MVPTVCQYVNLQVPIFDFGAHVSTFRRSDFQAPDSKYAFLDYAHEETNLLGQVGARTAHSHGDRGGEQWTATKIIFFPEIIDMALLRGVGDMIFSIFYIM